MIYGRNRCDEINGCGKYYQQTLTCCPYCGTPQLFSDFVPFNPLDWVYDLETYPNVFTADFKHPMTGTRYLFEYSFRKNQLRDLIVFLNALISTRCRMVGFNNVGFDYPILHYILKHYINGLSVDNIYQKAQAIIDTPWNNRFDNVIWDSEAKIQQIDLSKIHHFDNDSRTTSLKMLEFNMRSDNVEDLPFPPKTLLTPEQVPVLIKYNDHDVDETEQFYIHSLEMIEFREQLGRQHNHNFLNHSDKKIGTTLFINALELASPGSCYHRVNNKKTPRQTYRSSIHIGSIIFPYIQFKHPEFQRVRNWLSSQVITETKGVFKGLSCTINGFTFDFGTGGIHGSIESCVVESDDDNVIYDWDVGGYYPTLGAVNNLFPEHLSAQFGVVDAGLKAERAKHKKGTALNNAIKLARNGAYGDSNSQYSPFYDPQYTMSITINGQLLLCLLSEHLMDIPGLRMVQINTDGMTVLCPRKYVDQMKTICKWWEGFTCLELESAIYSRMFIRDVNSYIGEYDNGKLKSKGAYVHKTKLSQGATWTPHDMDWHQNHSHMIVAKAAEAVLFRGENLERFIYNHTDIHDFMLRTKVKRSDDLVITDSNGIETQLQKITRYYIGKKGGSLTKVSPPAKNYVVGVWKRANGLTDSFYNNVIDNLVMESMSFDRKEYRPDELDTSGLPWDDRINTKNKSKYEIRRTSFQVGKLVCPCNDISVVDRQNIDFQFYIDEAKKLIDPLLGD